MLDRLSVAFNKRILIDWLMSCSGWLIEMCDELFSRTVNILPLSDRINEMHSRTLSNLKLTSPDIEFPALHVEVYDGQPWSAANFTSSDLDDSVVWWPHWRSEFCLFVCFAEFTFVAWNCCPVPPYVTDVLACVLSTRVLMHVVIVLFCCHILCVTMQPDLPDTETACW